MCSIIFIYVLYFIILFQSDFWNSGKGHSFTSNPKKIPPRKVLKLPILCAFMSCTDTEL